VVEALQQQRADIQEKKRRKKRKVVAAESSRDYANRTENDRQEVYEACDALESFSMICNLTQKFKTSEDELPKIDM
jgi:hypothetical protein